MQTAKKTTAKQLTLDLTFLHGGYIVKIDKSSGSYELTSENDVITETVISILERNYGLRLKHIRLSAYGKIVGCFRNE